MIAQTLTIAKYLTMIKILTVIIRTKVHVVFIVATRIINYNNPKPLNPEP